MKKMFKSVWAIIMVAIGMVFLTAHGQSPVVKVEVVLSAGPLKGSPEFQDYSQSFMKAVMTGQFQTGAPSKTEFRRIGDKKLDPNYLQGGWTIWSAVVITSDTPFVPTNITSQILSSPNGLFNKLDVFSNPDLVYSGTSVGIVTDSNGVKNFVTGGRWNEKSITTFGFLGVASKTMNGDTQAQKDSNSAWVYSFSNFVKDYSWSILLGGNRYTGSSTLETHPFVLLDPPTLVITRDAGGIKVSSPDLPTGISADVLRSPDWSVVGTITGTQTLAIPVGQQIELFRLRVTQ